jgi:hypothetical protein
MGTVTNISVLPDARSSKLDRVSIRPGVSVLSVLRHLNYRSWFALAEFVDNSLQSYLSNRRKLENLHGNKFQLQVSIDIDPVLPGRISIKDNAAGIAAEDFPRAFRPAAVPIDRSGLSEFGIGMKSAACWFAPRWHVRTKAIGESVERNVQFDVAQIVHDQIEELDIVETVAKPETHFTEVVLEGLYHLPVKKSVAKIKEHLADIYRVFIRSGTLELRVNGELLEVEIPPILRAPFFRELEGKIRLWRKDISFDLGNGMKVSGFAALRDPGNYARSGFALFRRDRLIQGSGEEGYRPSLIFAQPGSYRYLRLFGELHLEGFDVSHTKDGFRWDENEQPFLELLKEHLDSEELPLLRQADGFRALATKAERMAVAREAVDHTASILNETLPAVLEQVSVQPLIETSTRLLGDQPSLAAKEIDIEFRGEKWRIKIELADDPAESQWLTISNTSGPGDIANFVEIRVSMAHPFMVSFAQTNAGDVEILLRVASALALAETLARRSGVKMAGTIRRNLNDILRDALSKLT